MAVQSMPSSQVDVLIVGAGPAGLMLALWMAKLGIKTRVVDKNSNKIFCGQADWLNQRSMEILDSFGIGDRVPKDGQYIQELVYWGPGENGSLKRTSRVSASDPALSHHYKYSIHQGFVESYFLDAIEAASSSVQISRSVIPSTLHIDEGLALKANTLEDELRTRDGSETMQRDNIYPIRVTLDHLTEQAATTKQISGETLDGLHRSNLTEGDPDAILNGNSTKAVNDVQLPPTETVHARYMIGCDGARSWVRQNLGTEYQFEGDHVDSIWGVIDIVPITDYPDIRCNTIIQSANHGSMLTIARENRLIRLYCQLKEVVRKGERYDISQITPAGIMEVANLVMKPFSITYKHVAWWSAFQVGQRLAPRLSKLGRVFLAGDAVHTHSPKAGLGMNTSLQDTCNLGWKIGLVCKGLLRHRALSTYDSERGEVAQGLIAFDKMLSGAYKEPSAGTAQDLSTQSIEEINGAYTSSDAILSGLGTKYGPSMLVAHDEAFGKLLKNRSALSTLQGDIKAPQVNRSLVSTAQDLIGSRFPSHKVVNQADATIGELHDALPSNGQFRVVVFGADISRPEQLSRVNSFGSWLNSLPWRSATLTIPQGPALSRNQGASLPLIDLLLLHSASREDIEWLTDLHEAYHPFDPDFGWEYRKIFTTKSTYHPTIHETVDDTYGVDMSGSGKVFVLRPDGHVSMVKNLDDPLLRDQLAQWLEAFLR